VYSTRLKDERFSVECIVYTEKVRIIQYVVDTGAKYTCCNYKEFDKHMKEEEFIECDTKLFGGFIEGSGVKFYKYHVMQFTIGNIDMGEQDIWITFDKRVKETILGMDILKQITFLANADNKQICFYKDYIECKKMIIVDCGSEAGMDCPGGGAAVVL